MLGLEPVPSGGAAVESAARGGDPKAFPFSIPLARQANCNFSFAGLKTAVRTAAERALPPPGHPDRGQVPLCSAFILRSPGGRMGVCWEF
jgi:N6-L-threonylcarbamoyladenine synthase